MFWVFIIQFLLYWLASAFGYFFGVRKNLAWKNDVSWSAIIGIVWGGVIASSTFSTEYLKLHFAKDSIVPVAAPFVIFLAVIILLYVLAWYQAKKLGADTIAAKKISEKTMSTPILLMMIFTVLGLLWMLPSMI